jgi:hypothetical protein
MDPLQNSKTRLVKIAGGTIVTRHKSDFVSKLNIRNAITVDNTNQLLVQIPKFIRFRSRASIEF